MRPRFTARNPDQQRTSAVRSELGTELVEGPVSKGNGRVARLLALLMALQAGLPPLNFSALEGRGKAKYIAAIHAAVGRNYEPLAAQFERVIDRTLKRYVASNAP